MNTFHWIGTRFTLNMYLPIYGNIIFKHCLVVFVVYVDSVLQTVQEKSWKYLGSLDTALEVDKCALLLGVSSTW